MAVVSHTGIFLALASHAESLLAVMGLLCFQGVVQLPNQVQQVLLCHHMSSSASWPAFRLALVCIICMTTGKAVTQSYSVSELVIASCSFGRMILGIG